MSKLNRQPISETKPENEASPERKKRNSLRSQMIAAYEAWLRKEPYSLDSLIEVVRKFAYGKVYHLEYEFRDMGSAETADDWAQEITIKVWQGLEKIVGTPELFYSWVHKLANNQGVDAYNDLIEQKQTMVPLMVPMIDDDGNETDELTDNPAIYERSTGVEHVCIPDSVTGIDYNICLSLMVGVHHERPDGTWGERAKTYAEIGTELNMREEQVKQRLKNLRKRLKAEKAEEKKQNLARWTRAKKVVR